MRDVGEAQRPPPRLLARAPRRELGIRRDDAADGDDRPSAVRVRGGLPRPRRVRRAVRHRLHRRQRRVHAHVVLRLAAPVLERARALALAPPQRAPVLVLEVVARPRVRERLALLHPGALELVRGPRGAARAEVRAGALDPPSVRAGPVQTPRHRVVPALDEVAAQKRRRPGRRERTPRARLVLAVVPVVEPAAAEIAVVVVVVGHVDIHGRGRRHHRGGVRQVPGRALLRRRRVVAEGRPGAPLAARRHLTERVEPRTHLLVVHAVAAREGGVRAPHGAARARGARGDAGERPGGRVRRRGNRVVAVGARVGLGLGLGLGERLEDEAEGARGDGAARALARAHARAAVRDARDRRRGGRLGVRGRGGGVGGGVDVARQERDPARARGAAREADAAARGGAGELGGLERALGRARAVVRGEGFPARARERRGAVRGADRTTTTRGGRGGISESRAGPFRFIRSFARRRDAARGRT